jgi:ribosome-associated translation inhibitor RaiA
LDNSSDVKFKEEKSLMERQDMEVMLSCPGPRIFASSNEDSFSTVAETVRDLEVQLKNVKVRCRSIKKNKSSNLFWYVALFFHQV